MRWAVKDYDTQWQKKFAWSPRYYWGEDGNEHVIWLESYERRKSPYPLTYRIDGKEFKAVMVCGE